MTSPFSCSPNLGGIHLPGHANWETVVYYAQVGKYVVQPKREVSMFGAGGLVTSIIVFGVGAVLDYAITINPNQHGFNLNKVGVILMIVGAVGAVVSLIAMVLANTRRRRMVVDDGQGNAVRRVDSTY
jgi:hypothetical protein